MKINPADKIPPSEDSEENAQVGTRYLIVCSSLVRSTFSVHSKAERFHPCLKQLKTVSLTELSKSCAQHVVASHAVVFRGVVLPSRVTRLP